MGDPLSPGMTTGACAWMEKDWMASIHPNDKKWFRCKRFMDDILLVFAKDSSWDSERFIEDFTKSECYWPPLKLEMGGEDTFLETTFKIKDGKTFLHRLKNANEGLEEPKVWRYHHYESYGSYTQKRATLLATLRKVHNMASNASQLLFSGAEKLKEFAKLGYPRGIRKTMCGIMARDTEDYTWYRILHTQNWV